MKKLIFALILLTGCKKDIEKQSVLPPKVETQCITKGYGGLYKGVKYKGTNWPNTDTMRLLISDSAKLEFLGQTRINDTVIYFQCKIGCDDTDLPCNWGILTHYLVMGDTVADYIIVNKNDSMGVKYYVKISH